jgi:hypothetical protein
MDQGKRAAFIAINKASLAVSVEQRRLAGHINVPVRNAGAGRFAKMVTYRVLYPLTEADYPARPGKRIRRRLVPPSESLMTMAYIMWEGFLRDLPWEAVKVLCRAALRRLRAEGLAPKPKRSALSARVERSREVGFSWTDGRQLRRFNIKLRSVYDERHPRSQSESPSPRRGRTERKPN